MPLSSETLTAYLQLARSDGVGAITFQRLLNLYGTPQEALQNLPDLARRGGRKKSLKAASKSMVEDEIAETAKHNGTYLVWKTDDYPKLLTEIPDAPPVLLAFGHRHLLDKPAFAIVGARNASAASLRITESIASGVSHNEFVIVSGLARGIDGAAHKAAIENGTIAVIGNGITHQYPPENAALQDAILEQGLLLSEHAPDTPPLSQNFPRRNRIISGLALGVLVVEAARRSGSLITARLAAEQNREVMAVPGSPLDPRCLGANNLIREGAALIENADDVLDIIAPLQQMELKARSSEPPSAVPEMPPELSEDDRERILSLLSAVPVGVDELVERSGLSVRAVHLALVELELAGRIAQEGGGRVVLLF